MRTFLLTLTLLLALWPRLTSAEPSTMVTMTAHLDKSVYQPGQLILLDIALHNSGSQKVQIGMTADRQSSFQITVTEASGRIVPRTALGNFIFTPMLLASANATVMIGPRTTCYFRFSLTDLYDLSESGSYTVSVSRTLGSFWLRPQEPVLKAGPFKFQVVKASAPQTAPATPFVHDPSADVNLP